MSRFVAFVYDPFMKKMEESCLASWRGELLSNVEGEVLEVGAGTGANLPYYLQRWRTETSTRFVLSESDSFMRRRLAARVAETVDTSERGPSCEVVAADLGALPFADESFDVIVATLVLCSVNEQARALSEVRRVLRPGGRFVFLEHVAAEPESSRLKWQRFCEPVWTRLAGNCHLTRDTALAIERAGFEFESLTREDMRKGWPLVRATIRGSARKAV